MLVQVTRSRIMPSLIAAILLFLFLLSDGRCLGAIWYVDADAAGGNGTTWGQAFNNLQSGLSAASSGDQIWVRASTNLYKPGSTRSSTFALVPGVRLYGGFDGTEPGSDPPPARTGVAVLSGEIQTGSASDNCYHVVTVSSSCSSTTVIDRFEIRRGNADGGAVTGGGGMYCQGSPTISNCIFTENFGSRGAGLLLVASGATVTITLCDFLSNVAWGGRGGGASCELATITFDRCDFADNLLGSTSGVVSHGGGLEVAATAGITIIGSDEIMSGNYAGHSLTEGGSLLDGVPSGTYSGYGIGGGAYLVASNPLGAGPNIKISDAGTDVPLVNRPYFVKNHALDAAMGTRGSAGAVYASAPTIKVRNIRFNYNVAENVNQHCHFVPTSGNAYLVSCEFLQPPYDSNSGDCGGLRVTGGTTRLMNCRFNDVDIAGNGGGIYAESSATVLVYNSNFQNGRASSGSAIYMNSATVTVVNSIFWGNTGGLFGGGTPTVTYSDVEGGYSGTGNINSDPLVSTCDFGNGSPVINVGLNASVPTDWTDIDNDNNTGETTPLDFCGYARIVCPTMSPVVDMGVGENQQCSLPSMAFPEYLDLFFRDAAAADFNGDGRVTATDLYGFLDRYLAGFP